MWHFNRIVVVRYRMYLESRHLAANTINQQLVAVRAHPALVLNAIKNFDWTDVLPQLSVER